MLVDQAHLGRTVVRLKGGDPFVFGRGGEELLACAEAGIPCEVIPGVTSALSAPAAAGIPVTHRGIARSFAVVTASTTGAAHEPDAVDLSTVATATDTLVLLMAAGRLAETCAALIAAGRPADEPAALVMWATTPEERTVIGTLDGPAGAGRGREHGAAGDADRRRRRGHSSRDRAAHTNASRSRRSATTGPCQSSSGSGVSRSATFRSGGRIRYACIADRARPGQLAVGAVPAIQARGRVDLETIGRVSIDRRIGLAQADLAGEHLHVHEPAERRRVPQRRRVRRAHRDQRRRHTSRAQLRQHLDGTHAWVEPPAVHRRARRQRSLDLRRRRLRHLERRADGAHVARHPVLEGALLAIHPGAVPLGAKRRRIGTEDHRHPRGRFIESRSRDLGHERAEQIEDDGVGAQPRRQSSTSSPYITRST